jgi:hypothetical protein
MVCLMQCHAHTINPSVYVHAHVCLIYTENMIKDILGMPHYKCIHLAEIHYLCIYIGIKHETSFDGMLDVMRTL